MFIDQNLDNVMKMESSQKMHRHLNVIITFNVFFYYSQEFLSYLICNFVFCAFPSPTSINMDYFIDKTLTCKALLPKYDPLQNRHVKLK